MKTRLAVPLILLLASVGSHMAAESLPQPEFGKEILTRLRDPAQRVAAIVAIEEKTAEKKWTAAKRRTAPFGIRDPRVTLFPAREGPPRYLVSYSTDWVSEERAQLLLAGKLPPREPHEYPPLTVPGAKPVLKPRQPSGAGETDGLSPLSKGKLIGRSLILLTSEGRATTGYLSGGYVMDVNGDGIPETADSTNWGDPGKGSSGTNIQSLQIQTLEPQPCTLLHVIYNWHEGGGQWGFEIADVDGDGTPEACLGPAAGEDRLLSREVIYRWDAAKAAWQGPDGAQDDHFRRFNGKDDVFWDWLRELSKAGGVGKPQPADSADKLPPPEPPSAPPAELSPDAQLLRLYLGSVSGESFDGEGFHLPPRVWELPAKEAALALADGNRTAAHRRQFELLTDPAAGAPPATGSVQVFQKNYWSSSYCTLLELTAADGRWSVMDEDGPSFTAAPTVEEGRWLFQTLWWLDQIRTRLGDPLETAPDNEIKGGADIPDFTLLLTADGKAPGVSLPRSILQPVGPGWRGQYDRNIAHRLAIELCQAWAERRGFPHVKKQKADAGSIMEQLRKMKPGERGFPEMWAGAVVKAAGHAVVAGAVPELDRLRKVSGLTKDLRLAKLKIAAGNDHAKLKALAVPKKDGDYHLSHWAAQRLKQQEDDTMTASLAAGKPIPLGDDEAEKSVPVMIRKGYTAEAIAWFRALPAERSEKIVWLLDLLPDAERRDKAWREDLVRALSAPRHGEPPDWLPKAVRYLVPADSPHLHEGQDIDELLVRLIEKTPRPPSADPLAPWSDGGLQAACAAALARRATDTSRLKVISSTAGYDYFGSHNSPGCLNEAEAALAHMAVKFPGAAAEQLVAVVQSRLKQTQGRDAAAAFLAWTADLRTTATLLSEKATTGPTDAESSYARTWGGDHKFPERTHAARRVVSIWREQNPLTKTKALICLAALEDFREEAPGLYGPASRLRDQFAATFAALSPADRKAAETFAGTLSDLDAGISLDSGTDLSAAQKWAQEQMKAPTR